MNFQDYFGQETQYKEYKVVNFYLTGLPVSNSDIISLLETKKWLFNNDIINTIKQMITIYLAKYTCAYLSNNSNSDSELYFGIDDDGFIHGIPYQGLLDKNIIMNHCKEVLKDNLKFEGNIFDYLNIDIIKMNYVVDDNIPLIHPYYRKYMEIIKLNKIRYNKFMLCKATWIKLLDRYNAKLSDLINNKDTRVELINYIEMIDPFNPTIKLLKTDFIMPIIKAIDLDKYKIDKNSIYYWVTIWKDKMLQFVKSIRPRINSKIPHPYYPRNIMYSVKHMIPYWMKHNTDMNLYLIKFTFKQTEKLDLEYKNIYKQWIKCYRTLNDGKPCCQPY